MRHYSLAHLSDAVLLRDLAALLSQDRVTTAELLAHIAEVDARRLYVPAGYSSMHAYCVDELRLSEGAAFKRIRAARAARDFPELFPAVARGRLHLAAVCLLAPYLTRENVEELMAAATHRRKSEIEVYLARKFPLGEVPAGRYVAEVVLRPIPAPRRRAEDEATGDLLSPGAVTNEATITEPTATEPTAGRSEHGELSPGAVDAGALSRGPAEMPGAVSPGTVRNRRAPAALSERYLLKLILDKETHDRLRYAQTLLSHTLPSGDIAQVLRRALDVLIPQLEKRKFGAVSRERQFRPPLRPSTAGRHIPAYIRRAVWKRDQGRCTFVAASGHRCNAKRLIEFDHVDPHVRTPEATVEGLRLRCRAHNQYEAERIFGAGFMARKLEEARARGGKKQRLETASDVKNAARTREDSSRRKRTSV